MRACSGLGSGFAVEAFQTSKFDFKHERLSGRAQGACLPVPIGSLRRDGQPPNFPDLPAATAPLTFNASTEYSTPESESAGRLSSASRLRWP